MTRSFLKTGLALLFLVAATSVARAQELSAEVAKLAGKDVDLRSDTQLRDELVERGLIEPTTFQLHVTSAFLEKVFASERFHAHVTGSRYHVGDRVLVEDKGSDGKFNPRAEIEAILPDGTYKVKVWDKVEALTSPTLPGLPNEFSGAAPPGSQPTRYKITMPDGSVREEVSDAPWLLRQNEREVILTHDQLDKLNGVVAERDAYTVNGWKIDAATDPVLAERFAAARAAADEIIPPSERVLPEDPDARKAQLEKLAKLQSKLVDRLFSDNLIDHPINPAVGERMRTYIAANPDMRGKIGAVLAAASGVCFDQAAAMVAIIHHVGEYVGLEARAINGRTIGESMGHGFVVVRLINGVLAMLDPSWHHRRGAHVVENMEFALFDARRYSNRRIDGMNEQTTNPTPFVADREALDRGYDASAGETLLALRAAEQAKATGEPLQVAAERVLAENAKADATSKVAGNFTAAGLVARAATFEAPTPGMLGVLERLRGGEGGDKVQDLVRERVLGADRGVEGR